eukprot:TRINITY_DN4801_c0_g1_i2.p1 TRINITY_DN4801_c0_g1~~TRINITY_DN4801_c0_g1_i2.p1  ORF type:complete len:533 (+),score=123.47 TRINITY_DN4801_c0_g1_i2:59-1600(+)
MSWELHPTQLGIGGGPEKELIGACIMNMLLLLGLSVVMVGAAGGVRAATGQSWEEARAAVRFPGICYIPYLFLLQGTSLAAARALFYPGGSVAIGLIGGATAFFSLSVPVLIHIRVVRAPSGKVVPDGAAVQMSGWQKFLYSFTFGNAIWVSAKEPLFCERFGVIFETVKKDALWCLPAECLGVIMLSVLSALQPGTVWMCNMRNLGLALTTALWFLVLVVKRPYFGYLEGLVNTGAAGLVFVAVVCMTVAIWGEVAPDHILLEVAAETLSVSGWMVVGKALWDVAGYLYDTCSGLKRTKRARAEARGECIVVDDEHDELVSLTGSVCVVGSRGRSMTSGAGEVLPRHVSSASFNSALVHEATAVPHITPAVSTYDDDLTALLDGVERSGVATSRPSKSVSNSGSIVRMQAGQRQRSAAGVSAMQMLSPSKARQARSMSSGASPRRQPGKVAPLALSGAGWDRTASDSMLALPCSPAGFKAARSPTFLGSPKRKGSTAGSPHGLSAGSGSFSI